MITYDNIVNNPIVSDSDLFDLYIEHSLNHSFKFTTPENKVDYFNGAVINSPQFAYGLWDLAQYKYYTENGGSYDLESDSALLLLDSLKILSPLANREKLYKFKQHAGVLKLPYFYTLRLGAEYEYIKNKSDSGNIYKELATDNMYFLEHTSQYRANNNLPQLQTTNNSNTIGLNERYMNICHYLITGKLIDGTNLTADSNIINIRSDSNELTPVSEIVKKYLKVFSVGKREFTEFKNPAKPDTTITRTLDILGAYKYDVPSRTFIILPSGAGIRPGDPTYRKYTNIDEYQSIKDSYGLNLSLTGILRTDYTSSGLYIPDEQSNNLEFNKYGTTDSTPISFSQITSLIGLNNLEAMAEEFNYFSKEIGKKSIDSLTFTNFLKAILTLEESDFYLINNEDPKTKGILDYKGIKLTAEKQIEFLQNYSYYITEDDKDNTNELNGDLVNFILSKVQYEKIKVVTKELLNQTIAFNNNTTTAYNKSENSNKEHSFLFSPEVLVNKPKTNKLALSDTYDSGFLLRTYIFGQSNIDTNHGINEEVDVTTYGLHRHELGYYSEIAKIIKQRRENLKLSYKSHGYKGESAKIDEKLNHLINFAYSFFCFTINVKHELNPVLIPYFRKFFLEYLIDLTVTTSISDVDQAMEIHTKAYDSMLQPRFDNYVKNCLNNYINDKSIKINHSLLTLNEFCKKEEKNFNEPRGIVDAKYLDLRLNTYYNIKAIYDTHASFNIDSGDMFFNYSKINKDDEHCFKLESPKIDGRNYRLSDYIKIVDRSNSDIGDSMIANLAIISDYLGAKNLLNHKDSFVYKTSFYNFFDNICKPHGLLMHSVPAWVDFGNIDSAETIFGVYDTLEVEPTTIPSLIFQFAGNMTSKLNNSNTVESKENSFKFDIDCNTGELDSSGSIPADVRESDATAFVVQFGNENQQMFNNLMIDTSQYQLTEPSIQAFVGLVKDSNNQLSGANLHKIYTNYSYHAQVDSLGNAMIQPLMYFYLKNIPLYYGSYWITNLSHSIRANNMKTTFKGVRQPIALAPSRDEILLEIAVYNNKIVFNDSEDEVSFDGSVNNVPTLPTKLDKDQLNENIFKVKQYFKNKGYSKEITAAIMGNIMAESLFDHLLSAIDSNEQYSAGLIMWNGINWKTTENPKPTENQILNKIGRTIESQLDYLINEYKPFKTFIRLSENITNVDELTYIFGRRVEVCAECVKPFSTFSTQGTGKKRIGWAKGFLERFDLVSDSLYWENDVIITNNLIKGTESIGDSLSITIDQTYKNINTIDGLANSNWNETDLLTILKGKNIPYNNVENVIVSIGSYNSWDVSNNTKTLIDLIKNRFPKAKYYICNGSYNWGNLVAGRVTDDEWVKRIKTYIDTFNKAGFKTIGTLTKLTSKPGINDEYYKSFEKDLKSF